MKVQPVKDGITLIIHKNKRDMSVQAAMRGRNWRDEALTKVWVVYVWVELACRTGSWGKH